MKLNNWFGLDKPQQKAVLKAAGAYSGLDEGDCIQLSNNLDTFNTFAKEAHKVRMAGKEHYSARTIIEVIRHYTAISDNDQTFKINNNIAPKLARVSMFVFPTLEGLFSLREKCNG